ncbi:MAG: hypothetical protein ACPGSB_05640, partial [Opitutales bacterium]
GVFLLTFTLPMNAKAIFSKRNFAIREQIWLEELSGDEIREHSIVLDRFTVPWSLRDWVAYSPVSFVEKPGLFLEEIRKGTHPAIFFVERLTYQNETFVPDYSYAVQLRNMFETELVDERSFRPFSLTRVHRVVRPREKEVE